MGLPKTRTTAHYVDKAITKRKLPKAALRRIGHVVRNIKVIPGYRAVIHTRTGHTYAIVSHNYKIVQHHEVVELLDSLSTQFPEFGKPTREVWLADYGDIMKARWTFSDVDITVRELPDGTPDIVHPTLEALCSYSNKYAQRISVGGFRVIGSNSIAAGRTLVSYKRTYTKNIDVEVAREVIAHAMSRYNRVTDLWSSYARRDASTREINCYKRIDFREDEKERVAKQIRSIGKVKHRGRGSRNVQINAWELMNILTAEATHNVNGIPRRDDLLNSIANIFAKGSK